MAAQESDYSLTNRYKEIEDVMANSFTDLQSRQEVSKSMCRLTHKTQGGDKVAIAKLDKTS